MLTSRLIYRLTLLILWPLACYFTVSALTLISP